MLLRVPYVMLGEPLAVNDSLFSRFLNGKQVAEELRDWCRGESKLEVALTIMARNCRNCGVIKWRCNCGMFWGEGETQYQPDQTDGFEEEEDETEDEEDEFDIDELAAWILRHINQPPP